MVSVARQGGLCSPGGAPPFPTPAKYGSRPWSEVVSVAGVVVEALTEAGDRLVVMVAVDLFLILLLLLRGALLGDPALLVEPVEPQEAFG